MPPPRLTHLPASCLLRTELANASNKTLAKERRGTKNEEFIKLGERKTAKAKILFLGK